MGGIWIARLDDVGPCNGDVIVRTAKGSLVAVIYSTGDEAKTLGRAHAFIKAAAPRWCTTCGIDTIDTETCAKCAEFWAEAGKAADDVLAEVSAWAESKQIT